MMRQWLFPLMFGCGLFCSAWFMMSATVNPTPLASLVQQHNHLLGAKAQHSHCCLSAWLREVIAQVAG